jgi:hypothetical protein
MNLTSPSNIAENSYIPQSTTPPCMLHNSPIWTKPGNLFLLIWGWPRTKNPDSKLVKFRMLIPVTYWWANVCKKHVLDHYCICVEGSSGISQKLSFGSVGSGKIPLHVVIITIPRIEIWHGLFVPILSGNNCPSIGETVAYTMWYVQWIDSKVLGTSMGKKQKKHSTYWWHLLLERTDIGTPAWSLD